MNLPKAWNEILVDQYIELRGLESVPSDSFIDIDLEIISIVTDTDIDELEDLTMSEVGDILKSLKWIRKEPPKTILKTFTDYVTPRKFRRYTYKGMVFTLGEYIELNYLFSTNFVENLPLICAVLYRQEGEAYDYDPNDRKHLFYEMPITNIYGIIGDFITYKENFEETYVNLFEGDYSDEPEPEDEDKEAQAEEDRQNKWSWERLVYSVCGGDLTKRDKVLDLELVFVFNMLAMKKDLNLE
jgi:hypothetical protein